MLLYYSYLRSTDNDEIPLSISIVVSKRRFMFEDLIDISILVRKNHWNPEMFFPARQLTGQINKPPN